MRRSLVMLALAAGCANMTLIPPKQPLSPLPADLASCAVDSLPRVTSQYDPVTDTTTAYIQPLTFGNGLGTIWRVLSQARVTGRTSTAKVAPYLWVHTGSEIDASSPSFTVLVDDSVRFSWPERGMGFSRVKTGLFGTSEGSIEYHSYTPPLAEYARLASGKSATVAWAHVRQTMGERDLRGFAELYLWAQCPQLRQAPTVVK